MNCSNYCVLKKRSIKIKSERKEHQKAELIANLPIDRTHQTLFDWKPRVLPRRISEFCSNKSDKCWIVQRTKQGTRLLLKEFRRSDKLFPLAVTNFCNTRVPNHLPGGGREEQTVTV